MSLASDDFFPYIFKARWITFVEFNSSDCWDNGSRFINILISYGLAKTKR